MAFINSHKQLTVNAELDLFSVPPTQESVEAGHFMSYRPISSITSNAPIEFCVSNSGSDYIDVSQIYLYLKVKIHKKSTATVDEDDIGPVNNFMHSLFSQVDVLLNGKTITPPSNQYAYRSYITNLLNYGRDAKESHLTTSLWYKDTAGDMGPGELNSGYNKRKAMTKDNETFDMISPLHIDLKSTTKYLINGVEMVVKLIQSKPEFCLMSPNGNPNTILSIEEAELFVRKVKISPSVLVGHSRALAIGTAKYPITRVEVKTVTIPAGVQNKTIEGIFTGQLPKKIIVGFVKNRAFNGSYLDNPFDFQHFNLSFLSFYMDSIQIPAKPFTPQFDKRLWVREYNSLFEGSGIFYKDAGIDLDRNEYGTGYFLVSVDLTSDLSSQEGHWTLLKNGNLRIELRFQKALEETITVVCFGEFDNLIEIDSNRNVIIDYSS
jgi:hypothetical protein